KQSLFGRMTSSFRNAAAPQPMPQAEPRAAAPSWPAREEPSYQAPQHLDREMPQAPATEHASYHVPPQHHEPRAAVRLTQNEEIGIDIPAFLRRQQS
ncbi:MAG: cell division protein FtsZ, partial [Rhodospirillales bacterium]|nr:cell division protein FtsZ [Rhodospirillales bacterium]